MEWLILITGGIGGFFLHLVGMKTSFKQRTIDNKIKVYDAIIVNWITLRNDVFKTHKFITGKDASANDWLDADKAYGNSVCSVAEAILISEDETLTNDINSLNEKIFRTEWQKLELRETNKIMDELQIEVFAMVKRMRQDIKASTSLNIKDLVQTLTSLFRN